MMRWRVLYAVMRAGFWNKVRTYRFLLTLGLTIVAGYLFVPPPEATYVTLAWHSPDFSTIYRGVYNSTWLGALVAMLTGIFLTLFGFYVVNDTVKRDEQTRVGQILATTPLRNAEYTVGNACCNFAVLSTMTAIICFTTLGMQLVRGEDRTLDVWALLAPFVVLVLPLLFFVAALAVLFETRPLLRGGGGNIIYLFLWVFSLPLATEYIDLFGMNGILASMGTAAQATYPEVARQQFSMGFNWGIPPQRTLATFPWQGMLWTSELLLTRLLLVGFALGIALLASVRFNRFDPARASPQGPAISPAEGLAVAEVDPSTVLPFQASPLRPLEAQTPQFRLGPIVFAECRLFATEFPFLRRWGLVAASALLLAGFLLPLDAARGLLLPIAWFLPVLLWSKLGTREARHRTDQLIFSSAHALTRQLPAVWLAGLVLALSTGSGVALNLALHGAWRGVLAWGVGACFIPSLALCLGVWTGSSKWFEFLYPLLWYLGPLNGGEALDFMGTLPNSVEAGIWQVYLALTLVLVGLAVLGRKWQMQRG